MNNLLRTTIVGLATGIIGTGAGGALAFIIKRPKKRFLSGALGLSSGLMIAVVTFELIPEAFLISGIFLTSLGVAIGGFLTSYLDIIITRLQGGGGSQGQAYIKTGILVGVGIALHNFPEGLAIGSGFAAQTRLGLGLAIVIGLHNMPEGIAMVAPLGAGGYSSGKAFLWTLLAGVPMGMGALMGALIGHYAYELIGVCLAFAGGTMLYISLGELIPKGKDIYGGRMSTILALLGFIMGMIISKKF